jgi:hypothetical protein
MEDSLLLQIFFSFPHLSRQCRLGQKNPKYSPPHPIHLTISSPSAHAIHNSPSMQIVLTKKRSGFYLPLQDSRHVLASGIINGLKPLTWLNSVTL